MSICLITTLKEAVKDESLLKMGDLLVHFKDKGLGVRSLAINSSSDTTVNIKGNSYFTDSTGSSNQGSSKIIGPNTNTTLYLKDGTFEVVISGKYDISMCANVDRGMEITSSDLWGMTSLIGIQATIDGDFSDLVACKNVAVCYLNGDPVGDIATLRELSRLEAFALRDSKRIYGNLSSLSEKTNMDRLILSGSNIEGNIASLSGMTLMKELELNRMPKVTGNLSALSSMTLMESLSINNSGITGNISSLSNMTRLRTLEVANTAIVGDTSSLANLTNLTSFYYANTAITGTWPLT